MTGAFELLQRCRMDPRWASGQIMSLAPAIAVMVEENERLRTDNEHLRATLQTMEERRSVSIEHLPCVTAP